jgi:hypothetical protein
MRSRDFRHSLSVRPRAGFSPGLGLVMALAILALRVQAFDRWEALAQIESGDRDDAIGAAGEISRYQIRPEIWRRYASIGANWKNSEDSLQVAKAIMKERTDAFEQSFHRAPTDWEFYVLWNAPARISHPNRVVRDRAERFCNLVGALRESYRGSVRQP